MDDLAHARALVERLGAVFCLGYLKGVDATEALRRMGASVVARNAGAWTLVVEPGGTRTSDVGLIRVASRGTEMVSLSHHGVDHFAYAVDGTVVTGFDPAYPAEETAWGSDPGFLRPLLTALGLRVPTDEADTAWQDATGRAVVLAQRITGVRVPLDII